MSDPLINFAVRHRELTVQLLIGVILVVKGAILSAQRNRGVAGGFMYTAGLLILIDFVFRIPFL